MVPKFPGDQHLAPGSTRILLVFISLLARHSPLHGHETIPLQFRVRFVLWIYFFSLIYMYMPQMCLVTRPEGCQVLSDCSYGQW